MRRIALTVAFTDEAGATRQETKTIETSYAATPADEHRLVHIVEAELRVAVGEQAKPKHNATALKWLEFPNKPSPIQHYFDVQNSQAMWTELAHLVMGAEADLILAEAFKSLEPTQEPSFEDEAAINDLYYLHDRKMNLLSQAVHALIKVQDMIYRLLHESLGGDLIDTSTPDWEETQLRRTPILKGLEAKHAGGQLKSARLRCHPECARHSEICAESRHCAELPEPPDAPCPAFCRLRDLLREYPVAPR
jgi:hypothetical protein